MNVETVNEPIRVLAAFAGGEIRPLRFRWGRRAYRIDRVNARWTDRGGDGFTLHYSVQVDDETYYLHFAADDVQWWLDKVIVE
jgi:hypothetical protein